MLPDPNPEQHKYILTTLFLLLFLVYDSIYVLPVYGSYKVDICLNYMDDSRTYVLVFFIMDNILITVNCVKIYILKYMCGKLQYTLSVWKVLHVFYNDYFLCTFCSWNESQ